MGKEELEELLVIGAKIKIGKGYSEHCYKSLKEGDIIELINGSFECENGLYSFIEDAPSIWDEKQKDFDSIYHLFGNDLEYFMDCEILTT
jgi:hypothetical protein